MQEVLQYEQIMQPMPRPQKLIVTNDDFASPPMMESVRFKVGPFRFAFRMFMWCLAPVYFCLGLLVDRIRGRKGQDAAAVRMRLTFEKLGGTFIKIGQQLSLRVDILPFRYCQELATMLDKVPPFPTSYAIGRIEATTGRKLDELFLTFDPQPIGSASIACVYQAVLLNGKKVAVKVRRPRIGRKFAADFKAMDLLGNVLEAFSILRPGFTKRIRSSLKQALMEELDFRREARYQELFRQSSKKARSKYISAPKVYHDLCSSEVIVMEFIAGISLMEVITAFEKKDEKLLAYMSEMNIKPKKIAQRLLSVNYAGMITELFFHADPHPANVMVQKNGKLIFIDFGSCGSFSHKEKRHLQEISYYQQKGDPEGMAQASIALMEPLPPVNLDEYTRDLADLYRTSLLAVRSKHAHWWERTSAVQWFSFLKASMKHKVPLPTGMVHLIRATLLYDTMAARLNKNLNFYKEYRRAENFAGKLARMRLRAEKNRLKKEGLKPSSYLLAEQMVDTGSRLLFRVQRLVDDPPLKFTHTIGKFVYAIRIFIRFLSWTLVSAGLVTGIVALGYLAEGTPVNLWGIVKTVGTNPLYQIFIVIGLVVNIRTIMYRFGDRET